MGGVDETQQVDRDHPLPVLGVRPESRTDDHETSVVDHRVETRPKCATIRATAACA
jgi:hypothetical protein